MPGKRAIIENWVYKTITGYYHSFFQKHLFAQIYVNLKEYKKLLVLSE